MSSLFLWDVFADFGFENISRWSENIRKHQKFPIFDILVRFGSTFRKLFGAKAPDNLSS